MKKTIYFLCVLVASALTGKSQSWEKLLSSNSTDVFRSVREVPSGGFVVAGYMADSTANDTDGVVLRLTAGGDTMWTFRYNGPGSRKDLFYKVINTSDGGFALCGYTTSGTFGLDDYLYLKLNSSGQQQWVKILGGSQKDRAQDIIQTADGGYAIVGYSTSPPSQYYDAVLIKITAAGDTSWTKRYGTSVYDDANVVQQLADGGYLLGGQSISSGSNYDQYLVRTNSAGGLIWTSKFGSPSASDNIECLRVLSDGFIIAGTTNDGTSDNGSIVKTDTGGVPIWTKSYGGSAPDDFHRIEVTSDGGFIASGTTSSMGPLMPNMWLMKTNSSGDSTWSKAYGGDNHDHGYSGQQTSDGGYIIVGHSGSFGYYNEEGYIVKTDGNGLISNKLTYTTVRGLVIPPSGGCGSASTQIKVVIRNFGDETVPNVPVTIEITGALTQTLTQTYNSSFAPSETDTLTFTATINTSAGGTFNITAYTGNNNDVWPARNSYTTSVTYGAFAAPPSGTSAARCGSGTLNLSATSTGTVYWFSGAAGGTQLNSGNNFTTPFISSTTTYYAQTNLACPSTRTAVVATVNSQSPDPLTTGDSRCGAGTLTLVASSPDPVTWYDQSSGGSPVGSGSSFTTPSLSSTVIYYAQASNGSCPSSRVATNATVSQAASDPVTTGGSSCGAGTVTLSATSSDPVIWYDAAVGGAQVASGLSFVTPAISSTTVYYAQADNGCTSNRVPATATINTAATDPSITNGQNCGPGSVTLQATAADPVQWFSNSIGGTPVGSGSSFTTPVITNTAVYYAEANNGTCSSNRVAVSAVIQNLPFINLGPDVMMSGGMFVSDAGPGFSAYQWSNGATTQTLTLSTSGTFCVTVTDGNNCTNSDCILADFNVGIKQVSDQKDLTIFPNPATGRFTLHLNNTIRNASVRIMNLTGSVVKKDDRSSLSEIAYDLSDFPKGIYVVVISGENFSTARRIILE